MKRVLLEHGKYGVKVYDASTEELTFKNALIIFRYNYLKNYYEDTHGKEREKVNNIFHNNDEKEAYKFLHTRMDYEYERIEIRNVN